MADAKAFTIDFLSLALILSAAVFGYIAFRRRNKNLPPGPPRLPVLGSIPFIGEDVRKEAVSLSKRFNTDVVTIGLGPNVAIFLNTFDAIKEAFSGNKLIDRPHHIVFESFERIGILSSSGNLWDQHRRLSVSLLKGLGMGKRAGEELVSEEIKILVDEIRKCGPEKFNIRRLLMTFTTNVVCMTTIGERYHYHDKEFLDFVDLLGENVAAVNSNGLLGFYPSLRHLPGFSSVKRKYNEMFDFVTVLIKSHEKNFDPENIDNLCDAYLAEKKRNENNPDSTFTDRQIMMVMIDLVIAGSEIVAASIEWGLKNMVAHPDIQRKVQAEIDDVLGPEQLPNMNDRQRLPYTEATVLEIHRFASVTSIAIPHTNAKHDVPFHGFTIPKGAMVFQNIWAVHRDPKIWKNPDKFDPRNFLDDDGSVVYKKEFMAFGTGPRQCLGESLAKMEVFLAFVTLMQKFRFSNPEGAPKPNTDGIFGTMNIPVPFELCVTPRI